MKLSKAEKRVGYSSATQINTNQCHKSSVSPSSENVLEMQIIDPYAGHPNVGIERSEDQVEICVFQVVSSSPRLKFDSTALQVKTFSK